MNEKIKTEKEARNLSYAYSSLAICILTEINFRSPTGVKYTKQLIYLPGHSFQVADDGYGVSYIISHDDAVMFHISSKFSSKETVRAVLFPTMKSLFFLRLLSHFFVAIQLVFLLKFLKIVFRAGICRFLD